MSLIKCEECDNAISDKALTCVHCGNTRKENRELMRIWANIVHCKWFIDVCALILFLILACQVYDLAKKYWQPTNPPSRESGVAPLPRVKQVFNYDNDSFCSVCIRGWYVDQPFRMDGLRWGLCWYSMFYYMEEKDCSVEDCQMGGQKFPTDVSCL